MKKRLSSQKKKVQRCTSSWSELHFFFWQLFMERFNAVLLFLSAFLSPRFPTPASSPHSPHSRPPPGRVPRTLPACWVGRGTSSLLDSMPRSSTLECQWASWEVPSCSRLGAERSPTNCMLTCMCVWSLSSCVPLWQCLTSPQLFPSLSSSYSVCVGTSCPDAGRATSSLDLAVKPGSEGGRRRTRRYHTGGPGGGRKTSERFRTQPITANEVEESSG